jgi:hypothetical protein
MKTQINTLVSGNVGRVGTTCKERKEIASKVLSENPDGLHVQIDGNELEMFAFHNLGGELMGYSVDLTPEQAKNVFAIADDFVNRPDCVKLIFNISADMHCNYQVLRRKSITRRFKATQYIKVDESKVTIL